MRRKDIEIYFVITAIILFVLYFFLSFFVIGYEERTNKTELTRVVYQIMGYIVFSLKFWNKIFHSIIPLVLSILTSSAILTVIILLFKRIFVK